MVYETKPEYVKMMFSEILKRLEQKMFLIFNGKCSGRYWSSVGKTNLYNLKRVQFAIFQQFLESQPHPILPFILFF